MIPSALGYQIVIYSENSICGLLKSIRMILESIETYLHQIPRFIYLLSNKTQFYLCLQFLTHFFALLTSAPCFLTPCCPAPCNPTPFCLAPLYLPPLCLAFLVVLLLIEFPPCSLDQYDFKLDWTFVLKGFKFIIWTFFSDHCVQSISNVIVAPAKSKISFLFLPHRPIYLSISMQNYILHCIVVVFEQQKIRIISFLGFRIRYMEAESCNWSHFLANVLNYSLLITVGSRTVAVG